MGTWEHRAILEGNKGTRTPPGRPSFLERYSGFDIKTGAGSLARRDFVLLSSRVQDSHGESSGQQDLNISKIT